VPTTIDRNIGPLSIAALQDAAIIDRLGRDAVRGQTSLMMPITIPARTKMTMAIWVQIQKGDTRPPQ
jgi:hypothetical protein